MDLILVRHAIAYERSSLRWPDDSQRPLTPTGVAKFEEAARGLKRVVSSVDVVLSSPFVRAMQTAHVLEDVAGWPAAIQCPELEPSRSPVEVTHLLQEYTGAGVVGLVGHEPLLGELASYLIGGINVPAQPFKKGGTACFRSVDVPEAGTMTIRWWLSPKIARRLGPV